jgi:serine/threonine protein kinase
MNPFKKFWEKIKRKGKKENPEVTPLRRIHEPERYKLLRPLGEGKYSQVILVWASKACRYFAMKKCDLRDPDVKNMVESEISILQSVRHPNIIRLHDVFYTRDKRTGQKLFAYLILDYEQGGELYWYIDAGQRVLTDELEAAYLFKQLIDAIYYLNETCRIAHQDLKPENILLSDYGPFKRLKVADFGLGKPLRDDPKRLSSLLTKDMKEKKEKAQGSLQYIAPELLFDVHRTRTGKCDAFSCGVILWILFFGRFPYHIVEANMIGCDDILHQVFHYEQLVLLLDKYSKEWKSETKSVEPLSKEVKNFLLGLLHPNPDKRISLTEAVKHRWFQILADEKYEKKVLSLPKISSPTVVPTNTFYTIPLTPHFSHSRTVERSEVGSGILSLDKLNSDSLETL